MKRLVVILLIAFVIMLVLELGGFGFHPGVEL